MLTRLSLLHRPAGGEPTHEEKLVLDGWRKKLVMAMKQGWVREREREDGEREGKREPSLSIVRGCDSQ